jgi:hypothetical protein
MVDRFVAASTDKECFTPSGRHPFLPQRLLLPSLGSQVCQLTDVVNGNALFRSAELAFLGQQTLDHFTAAAPDRCSRLIVGASLARRQFFK